METKNYTQFNETAIKDINKVLEFGNEKENIKVSFTIKEHWEIEDMLESILEAIIFYGNYGNEKDLQNISSLASLAKKLLPKKQLEFLDNLLIKDSMATLKNDNFISIDKKTIEFVSK